MPMSNDYLLFPGNVPVERVLKDYLDRQGQWWWLLIAEMGGAYSVCPFGSLLPYLTGRTPQIVHTIGDCALCSGLDPHFWRGTGALVEEALSDAAGCSRQLTDLPMEDLPIVETEIAEGSEIGF